MSTKTWILFVVFSLYLGTLGQLFAQDESDILGAYSDWGSTMVDISTDTETTKVTKLSLRCEVKNNGNGTEDYPTIVRNFPEGTDWGKYKKITGWVYVTSSEPDIKSKAFCIVIFDRNLPKQQQITAWADVPANKWTWIEGDISEFKRNNVEFITPHFYEGSTYLNKEETYTWYINKLKLVGAEEKNNLSLEKDFEIKYAFVDKSPLDATYPVPGNWEIKKIQGRTFYPVVYYNYDFEHPFWKAATRLGITYEGFSLAWGVSPKKEVIDHVIGLGTPFIGGGLDIGEMTSNRTMDEKILNLKQTPDKAVDGSVDTTSAWWSGAEAPVPQWLEIDLEEPTEINGIHVFTYWDNTRYYGYRIETSLDRETWKTVVDYTKNNVPATNQGIRHTFEREKTKFVRVVVTANSANTAAHLVEVQIYGPGSDKNLAVGKKARASSFAGQRENELSRDFKSRALKLNEDTFLGSELGEWGDHYLKIAWKDWSVYDPASTWSGRKPANREEASRDLESFFKEYFNVVNGRVVSFLGYRLFHHQAADWGAKVLVMESGENIPNTQLQLAFTRGAARQFQVPWGVDFSGWFSGSMVYYLEGQPWGGAGTYGGGVSGPDYGHSLSLRKRVAYASYMAGTNFYIDEGGFMIMFTRDEKNELVLSPIGEFNKKFTEFTQKHKERGTSYTPIAAMIDYEHGWSPTGCTPHLIWAVFEPDEGDMMLEEFLYSIFPARVNEDEQGYYLANAPYGDIFDVLVANPKDHELDLKSLKGYRVLFLLGDIRLNKKHVVILSDYVKQGGTLVLNYSQAQLFPNNFIGIERIGDITRSGIASCTVDNYESVYQECTYPEVKLIGNTRPIVVDDDNMPLVTKSAFGKGYVITTLPLCSLGENRKLLKFIPHLVQHISQEVLPVRVRGDVEYIINTRGKGAWIITLINNNGVTKKPREKEKIESEAASTVRIFFDSKISKISEWLEEQPVVLEKENVAIIVIPPGDVRIIEVVLDE
ncbi:MAG: discoidin domain-containing protein [Candidatus Omnitrophota bacterium]